MPASVTTWLRCAFPLLLFLQDDSVHNWCYCNRFCSTAVNVNSYCFKRMISKLRLHGHSLIHCGGIENFVSHAEFRTAPRAVFSIIKQKLYLRIPLYLMPNAVIISPRNKEVGEQVCGIFYFTDRVCIWCETGVRMVADICICLLGCDAMYSGSSNMQAPSYQTIWHHILEGSNLHVHLPDVWSHGTLPVNL